MQVSIREMKNGLSKYLKLVQMGQDVVVTDRGRPVARLTLVASTPEDLEAEAIKRILALPWVRAGNGRKLKGASKPIRLKAGDKTAAEMVLEDRI